MQVNAHVSPHSDPPRAPRPGPDRTSSLRHANLRPWVSANGGRGGRGGRSGGPSDGRGGWDGVEGLQGGGRGRERERGF